MPAIRRDGDECREKNTLTRPFANYRLVFIPETFSLNGRQLPAMASLVPQSAIIAIAEDSFASRFGFKLFFFGEIRKKTK